MAATDKHCLQPRPISCADLFAGWYTAFLCQVCREKLYLVSHHALALLLALALMAPRYAMPLPL